MFIISWLKSTGAFVRLHAPKFQIRKLFSRCQNHNSPSIPSASAMDLPQQSILAFLDSANLLTRPLGIGYQSQPARFNVFSDGKQTSTFTFLYYLRLTTLLLFLWTETLYSLSVAVFVPTTDSSNRESLLHLADLAYYLLGSGGRHSLTIAIMAIRANAVALVTLHYLDSTAVWKSWRFEAAMTFKSLISSQRLSNRLVKVCRRARSVSARFGFLMTGLILLCQLVIHFIPESLFGGSSHTSKPPLYTHLYFSVVTVLYTIINTQFAADLVLLCSICREVFEEVNRLYSNESGGIPPLRRFKTFYWDFCQAALFAASLLSAYGRRIYVSVAASSMTVVVFCLYSALYGEGRELHEAFEMEELKPKSSNLSFKSALLLAYSAFHLGLLCYLSACIGAVDKTAKASGDIVYEELILELKKSGKKQSKIRFIDTKRIENQQGLLPMRRKFSTSELLYWKLHRYFHTVWCTVLSMTVLDSPVNSATFIMVCRFFLANNLYFNVFFAFNHQIITAILMVFAFIVGNFHF